MEEIVYRLIGYRDTEEALAFMRHLVQQENTQYSYQNCWVVEEDHKIVAAANVYNGAHLHLLRTPVLDYIKHRYQHNPAPEDETGEGEYYLDTLGVVPGYQGKGIGSALLQMIIQEYVHRQGQTLGLLVEEANPAAKRLYTRLGFIPVRQKYLLGKRLSHLQIKG